MQINTITSKILPSYSINRSKAHQFYAEPFRRTSLGADPGDRATWRTSGLCSKTRFCSLGAGGAGSSMVWRVSGWQTCRHCNGLPDQIYGRDQE